MNPDELQRWATLLRWIGLGVIVVGVLITVGSHYVSDVLVLGPQPAKLDRPEKVTDTAAATAVVNVNSNKSAEPHRAAIVPLRPAQFEFESKSRAGNGNGVGTATVGARSTAVSVPAAAVAPVPVPVPMAVPATENQVVNSNLPDGRTLVDEVVGGKPSVLIEHVKNSDRLEKEGKLKEADAELELAIESVSKTAGVLKGKGIDEAALEGFDASVQGRLLAQAVLLAYRMNEPSLGEARYARFLQHAPPPEIKAHLVKMLIDRGQGKLVRETVNAAVDSDDADAQRFMELLNDPNFPPEDER